MVASVSDGLGNGHGPSRALLSSVHALEFGGHWALHDGSDYDNVTTDNGRHQPMPWHMEKVEYLQ